ncbi:MAG: AI-2E family transporter [Steroidobacteraceae bacterium]
MSRTDTSGTQTVSRYVLIACLFALGVWMLRRFLPALCWAVVLAIAASSLYDHWLARFRGRHRHVWAAATFTTLIGIVLIVPLAYGAALAVGEAVSLVRAFIDSARNGPPALPQWILLLPHVGAWLQGLWLELFNSSGAGVALGAMAHARPVITFTRLVGVQVVRRIVTLAFTLLTLFFVFLNRDRLSEEVPIALDRLFGHAVQRLLHHAAAAIRATVDGIVLVAVGEGAIMGVVYALAGAPHQVLFGALTGIFAMVPFAAPVVFCFVALLLALKGSLAAAIVVLVACTVVLFAADHFVRPKIIGGAARLPFLWVLLGILGGIESFGLLGIFLGPALMAALVSIWDGWVAALPLSGADTDDDGTGGRKPPV